MSAARSATLARMTPGETMVRAILDSFADAIAITMPDRDVEWRPRKEPRADDADRLERVHARTVAVQREFEKSYEEQGLRVVTEGIRRVQIREGSSRDRDKFTAVVLHVVAEGEPVRTVFVPLEE